jgi:hypothetical protein
VDEEGAAEAAITARLAENVREVPDRMVFEDCAAGSADTVELVAVAGSAEAVPSGGLVELVIIEE